MVWFFSLIKNLKLKEENFSDFLLAILKDKWTLDDNDIDEIVMVHTFIFKTDKNLKKTYVIS